MKWLDFYQKFFPNIKTNQQKQNVICPFHGDKEPSLSLDLDSGLYFCHSCQEGGDVFRFYMRQNSCSFTQAKRAILGSDKVHVLSETEVRIAHENLMKNETLQKLLFIKRGWTQDIIKKLKLGWHEERVIIPIYNEDGLLVNLRKYDVLHKTKDKFKGVPGHNQVRLWPREVVSNNPVIIFAGEPDTILAIQFGFNACTFTGGEGTFRADLLPIFKDNDVYICYDVDKAGRDAANNLARKVSVHAKTTHILSLPADLLPPNGDFTDLFLRACSDKLDFHEIWQKVVDGATLIEPETKSSEESDYEKTDFYGAVEESKFGKCIQFRGMAIGKNFSPFYAPKRIDVSCDFTRGDSCKECKLFASGGRYVVEIDDSDTLNLIRCSSEEQKNRIKALAGIRNCSQFKAEIETITVEEIIISPTIDSERIDQQFVVRKCFTKGHNLQINRIYNLKGRTIPDPKNQEATHFFYNQEPEVSDLELFQLSESQKQNLKIFQPHKEDYVGIDTIVYQICRDLSYNIPEIIIGREKLVFAYDLVFHSVLRFKFLDSLVEKGWVEMLALGDTRTGKTKTAIKMCRHYGAGEYITLESATLPGLIGGMSQIGRDISFSWGLLPINDGRLVVLDEANGIHAETIGNLSSIRDNGIAERTVVGSTRRTSSRVRLIWISNPRSNTRISYYSSGVEAIRELMGKPEDVARLDFAVIVAKEDVDVDRINKASHSKPEHTFLKEYCKSLLMWAWSRKEKNIRFEKDAERAILHYAVEMSKKYSDSIPLVQGSVQRIKLAKLAVALACRLFSTEDGENVIVKAAHVEYVSHFLYDVYDSNYFGYRDYSNTRKEEDSIASEDDIKKVIESTINTKQFINKMLSQNLLNGDDIVDFSGLERDKGRQLRTTLVNNNCLKRKKLYYVKSPEFTKFLKKMLKEVSSAGTNKETS